MRTRVLVIAEGSDRDALMEWLQLAGFIAKGSSPADCQLQASRYQPDVVIVDVQVAYDVSRVLRAIDQVSPQTHVIVITARPGHVHAERARVTCLTKPVDLRRLQKLLLESQRIAV